MFDSSVIKFSFFLAAGIVFPFVVKGAETNLSAPVRLHLEITERDVRPIMAPASKEAQLALKRFRLPDGFKADVFAAEPMLANPVAFCLDEQGRVFVAETHRIVSSVLDIRRYMPMLDADIACRSVEDRLRMTEEYFGAAAKELALEPEILRLVQDKDGDGKADFSSVYAGGFNSALDGVASGALARHGKVWFANVPEITLLKGIDRDGHAKSRETFSHGYGVHFSYTGHDLHGLIFGPDGKLYFSFGDRGANVKTKEGETLFFPDEGAVFRCNPDGTEMEVVHRGLRNPQELAFDEFGNLFTGDNDFDHGDHERWVYVVEGGDSGWRIGYQHPPLNYDLVPWMADQLWIPHFPGQAAYIVPPVTNLDDGPSGLVYYPGTGLPAKYDGHFFLCQFKGNINKSGIRTFSLKPSGASFEMINSEQFLWNVEATDVDFGPDSRIYFSDWGEGWAYTGKGRIYTVAETNSIKAPIVRETQKIIAKGFDKSSQRELLKLLSHPNMRVRTEAQFTLAERGKKNIGALARIAADQLAKPVARRHAIWALGQIGRKNPEALVPLVPLLADSDSEIRAQSAKILGDCRCAKASDGLIKLLRDENLRVRFFAAQSLGKLQRGEAVEPILAMLRENNDRDVYLRHAGAFALSRCADISQLVAAAKDESTAVRMGVLLAMRQLARPEIAGFLNDRDELLVVEAARAINDVPIEAAIPKLAALIAGRKTFPAKYEKQFQALQLRVVNANFRSGQPENATALAVFASEDNLPAAAAEALNDLAIWAEPGRRDRIVGTYHAFSADRKSEAAVAALSPVIAGIVAGKADTVKLAAINAIIRLRLAKAGQLLYDLVAAPIHSADVRLEALKALEQLKDSRLYEAAKLAQADKDENIRKEGNRISALIKPETAIAQVRSVLEKGSTVEKQGAIASLASIPGTDGETVLSELLDKFSSGDLPAELELELIDAVAKRSSPSLTEKLKSIQSKNTSPLQKFHAALFGGNAESGKKIFFERAEASCLRCHKINGEGGDVGPAMTGIGARQTREYLLESMIQPNAKIAPGFETVVVVLKSGTSHAGVLKSEDKNELVLNSPEDGLVTISKANIKTRDRGSSGMPEGLGDILSQHEIRDLVEFLATSK